jgi:hypothetical protein
MHPTALLTFALLLATFAASAATPLPTGSATSAGASGSPASRITAQAVPPKGPTRGQLRIIEVAHRGKGDEFIFPLELQVYRVADGALLQRLEMEAQRSDSPEGQTGMEFLDLNDDGYQDLQVLTGHTGSAGASLAYNFYLWAPQLQRFVLSQTLSQMGELSKNKRRGCVDITRKCSSMSYNTTTYCFQQAKGTWREHASDGCPEVSGD